MKFRCMDPCLSATLHVCNYSAKWSHVHYQWGMRVKRHKTKSLTLRFSSIVVLKAFSSQGRKSNKQHTAKVLRGLVATLVRDHDKENIMSIVKE